MMSGVKISPRTNQPLSPLNHDDDDDDDHSDGDNDYDNDDDDEVNGDDDGINDDTDVDDDDVSNRRTLKDNHCKCIIFQMTSTKTQGQEVSLLFGSCEFQKYKYMNTFMNGKEPVGTGFHVHFTYFTKNVYGHLYCLLFIYNVILFHNFAQSL